MGGGTVCMFTCVCTCVGVQCGPLGAAYCKNTLAYRLHELVGNQTVKWGAWACVGKHAYTH